MEVKVEEVEEVEGLEEVVGLEHKEEEKVEDAPHEGHHHWLARREGSDPPYASFTLLVTLGNLYKCHLPSCNH